METNWAPRFNPGTLHVSWVLVTVWTLHTWVPIVTMSLVISVPNCVPVIVIVAASETLSGEAEIIDGAIEEENVKAQFGVALHVAWTPLT